MNNQELYNRILQRLEDIIEYRWNAYDIKIHEESMLQKGVRSGEIAQQAIARNIMEIIEENNIND